MSWNPTQYLKFADHRLRPALDLLAQIPVETPDAVYDLGCGPGNITEWLKRRWPESRIMGIDSSAEMLAEAKNRWPWLEWEQADIATWRPKNPAAVIYSNAALQWLDNHRALFPSIYAGLAPGGTLAVQMPRNFAQPSHALMRETAQDGPWREVLAPHIRVSPVAEPGEYWRLLKPLGAEIGLWESEYLQALEGEDAVLQWMLGTTLRPLLAALSDEWREAFLAAYGARLREVYPRENGVTLFPFRRLFILASRPR